MFKLMELVFLFNDLLMDLCIKGNVSNCLMKFVFFFLDVKKKVKIKIMR